MPLRSEPSSGAGRKRRLVAPLLVALMAATLLAACSAKFDATGPCTADGSSPGAYPDLEAQVPKSFRGAAPGELDSGRTCTTDGLGTLKTHGIAELRFAGATWQTGTDSGLSLATFTSGGSTALQPDWVAEFYQTGANAGKNVESVTKTPYDVAPGISGQKIDVLNGESYQSVVVWERNARVEVALIADFIREIQTKDAHEVVVRDAVNAWVAPAVAPAATPPPQPASS